MEGYKRSIKKLLPLVCEWETVALIGYEGDYGTRFIIAPNDLDDLGGALENTLHRLLDNGWTEDEIFAVTGMSKGEYEEGEDIYIDLDYTTPAIVAFRKLDLIKRTDISATCTCPRCGKAMDVVVNYNRDEHFYCKECRYPIGVGDELRTVADVQKEDGAFARLYEITFSVEPDKYENAKNDILEATEKAYFVGYDEKFLDIGWLDSYPEAKEFHETVDGVIAALAK